MSERRTLAKRVDDVSAIATSAHRIIDTAPRAKALTKKQLEDVMEEIEGMTIAIRDARRQCLRMLMRAP